MICILAWQSEIMSVPLAGHQRVEERFEAMLCQNENERFLEIRRITAFKGFPGDPLRTIVEVRLPLSGPISLPFPTKEGPP